MTGLPAEAPSPETLLAARQIVQRHHPRTPLLPAPLLSAASGCDVFVKYENLAPVRSFKGRGALACVEWLDEEQRRRGVVTASTGNHGQGVAWAATLAGVPAVVVVPEGTPALKRDAIARFGGDLRELGADLAEAAGAARELAERDGLLYVEDGEDASFMAGAGSLAFELLEDLPDVDVVIVPLGGGNLLAAAALVLKGANPSVRVIGVQSDAAPAGERSFRAGRVVVAPCRTFAGGLATTYPGRLALHVIHALVDDVLLVSEDDLRRGIVRLLGATGQLVEGAGAAAVAALELHGAAWRGRRVALVASGGNIPLDELASYLERFHPDPGGAP